MTTPQVSRTLEPQAPPLNRALADKSAGIAVRLDSLGPLARVANRHVERNRPAPAKRRKATEGP